MVIKRVLAGLLMLSGVAAAQTEDNCMEWAQTPMERAFCQVRAANVANLPSLQEFRRNPERTQRLLLRRPAQQAGVELPAETPAPARRPAPPAPSSAAPQTRAPAPARPAVDAGAQCSLRDAAIQCGDALYQLLGNRPNSQLAPDALSTVQLSLPEFADISGSAAGEGDALMAYMADAYQAYISAMAAIGLAANTMSFTRFYHTRQEVQASGASFAERLHTMFEFLKRDKAQMAVRTFYTDERPRDMAQCMRLNSEFWVCDNVQHNWVYQRR